VTALDALAGEPRWVAWRNELRGSKPTKVPYAPDGKKARAGDPSTWGTRKAAGARAAKIVNGQGGGIGIQLGDLGADTHLCGIDLDSAGDGPRWFPTFPRLPAENSGDLSHNELGAFMTGHAAQHERLVTGDHGASTRPFRRHATVGLLTF
jgi:hypothetical protein